MAIETIISGTPMPGLYPYGPNLAVATHTIDASGEKFAMRLFAPKSGVLDAFEFRRTTLTNTAGGVKVSIQGMDASGNPDGTPLVYRDAVSVTDAYVIPGKMTDDGTDTGVPLTVARGQSLYCVIEFASFTAGDSVGIEVLSGVQPLGNIYGNHYTTSWGKLADRTLRVALRYSDGSYPVPMGYGIPQGSVYISDSVTASSSPDEIGLIFSYPAPVLLGGAMLILDPEDTCEFRFYNPSVSSDALEVYSHITADRGSNLIGYHYFPFSKDYLVDANQECIISARGTGSSSVVLYLFDAPSSDYLQLMEMGAPWRYAYRTDLGVWSETATRRPFIHPIVSGIDHEIGGQPQPGFEGTP